MRFSGIIALFGTPVFGSLSPELQKILHSANNTELYSYPTDFTRGIIPKRIHSHNDYWRDIPFYTALSHGCVSVEADVWLINGTLFVGHEISALKSTRTFQSLYIDPILDAVKRANPSTQFTGDAKTKNGIFDASPFQTLFLFIDLKTLGSETWPAVIKALEPLRSAGYLSTTDGRTFNPGPVTAIGTGSTPYAYFNPDPASPSSPRDVFFDGPLASLASTNITALVSPVVSTSFLASVGEVLSDQRDALNATQLQVLREQLGEASKRGILSRYWETPGWPVGVRDAVWRVLWEEGVGLINADDLDAAAAFWKRG